MKHKIVQTLNAVDFISTAIYLYMGGVEANPVVLFFMLYIGEYVGLFTLKVFSALTILFIHIKAKTQTYMNTLLVIFTTLILWHIFVWVTM